MKMKLFFTLLATITLVTGCSTSQEKLLPPGDKTMAQVWAENTGGYVGNNTFIGNSTLKARNQISSNTNNATHQLQRNLDNNSAFTRSAENETKNLFPRLPNPDLVMYVFPHLTDTAEPVPVPGYTTVFPFYARVQYAQPGDNINKY